MREEHGAIIVGGVVTAATLQCPHCGMHFVSIAGSGRRRFWCARCGAVTCGEPKCDPCAPVEARLDHAEGRKTRHDDAIRDSGFIL